MAVVAMIARTVDGGPIGTGGHALIEASCVRYRLTTLAFSSTASIEDNRCSGTAFIDPRGVWVTSSLRTVP
jgi:hypothetical protein